MAGTQLDALGTDSRRDAGHAPNKGISASSQANERACSSCFGEIVGNREKKTSWPVVSHSKSDEDKRHPTSADSLAADERSAASTVMLQNSRMCVRVCFCESKQTMQ